MKNILASVFVALVSGATVYLLIDNLFERPSKSVKPDEFEEIEEVESYDNTIPITKPEKAETAS